jgi:hypothetical protein
MRPEKTFKLKPFGLRRSQDILPEGTAGCRRKEKGKTAAAPVMKFLKNLLARQFRIRYGSGRRRPAYARLDVDVQEIGVLMEQNRIKG